MNVIKYCRDLPKHKGQWYEPHECDTWWFEESDPNGGHPMSDLTEAADDLDRLEELEPRPGRVGLANRLRKLTHAIEPDRLKDGLKFAHITDSDGDYLIHVAQQVAAVLTPPEEPQ